MQYIYADFAVNSGDRALKVVQGMLGLDQTGNWDKATERAVTEWRDTVQPDVYAKFIKEFDKGKRTFYQGLALRGGPPSQPTYWRDSLKGWLSRSDDALSTRVIGGQANSWVKLPVRWQVEW